MSERIFVDTPNESGLLQQLLAEAKKKGGDGEMPLMPEQNEREWSREELELVVKQFSDKYDAERAAHQETQAKLDRAVSERALATETLCKLFDPNKRARVNTLLSELAETQAKLEQALRTVEVLSDSQTGRTIAAGIEDVKAGRIRSLDCIDGGCERYKFQQQLAETQAIARKLLGALEFNHSKHYEFCRTCDLIAKAKGVLPAAQALP